MKRRTPIRIANGKVYVWVKHKGKPFALNDNPHDIVQPGSFYLALPSSHAIILHEPWGKTHITHLATPASEPVS